MTSVQEGTSLKAYNTFGIDVKARYFAVFHNEEELRELLSRPAFFDLPKVVLGGGSNVLFTRDFDGLVLLNRIQGQELLESSGSERVVRIGGGENWHEFVMEAVERGWGGVENLSLIPGSVGAAPMQNIGAYGVELREVFDRLEAFDMQEQRVSSFNASDCRFGYRYSVFKGPLKDRYVITRVILRLDTDPVLRTDYRSLSAELERMGVVRPTIRTVSQAVINVRQSKLPDPQKTGNAGSFFKNPVIQKERYEDLKERYPELPSFPVDRDQVKIPAGWLIERMGWKGVSFGRYGVYPDQALVLVNYGGAKGSDLYELSARIRASVEAGFGIRLEREVNVIDACGVVKNSGDD